MAMLRSFAATPFIGHAADFDAALAGGIQPGDDVQQRRFAAAGRADQDRELAAVDLEVDALQHRQRAIALPDIANCAAPTCYFTAPAVRPRRK